MKLPFRRRTAPLPTLEVERVPDPLPPDAEEPAVEPVEPDHIGTEDDVEAINDAHEEELEHDSGADTPSAE